MDSDLLQSGMTLFIKHIMSQSPMRQGMDSDAEIPGSGSSGSGSCRNPL